MTTITILRAYFGDCTISRIRTDNGFQCMGLELPWQGNNQNVSCIPEGDYRYYVAHSPARKTNVIWFEDVPERSNIQIHVGNYTSQIRGCILTGMAITDINNDGILDVSQSQVAFDKLMNTVTDKGLIRIRAATKPVGVYL